MINCCLLRLRAVWYDFVTEQNLMDNPIKHSCAKDSGQKLFIWFGAPTREDPNEFSASIEFSYSLMDDISIFDKTKLLHGFIKLTELIWEFLCDPVQNRIYLRIRVEVAHIDFIRACRRNLDLPRKRGVQFVTFSFNS
jgi:hypothetical protein